MISHSVTLLKTKLKVSNTMDAEILLKCCKNRNLYYMLYALYIICLYLCYIEFHFDYIFHIYVICFIKYLYMSVFF